jgi:carboxylesterase
MSHKETHPSKWKTIAKWIGIILLAFVGVILLLGIIPVRVPDLPSHPNPVNSYDEAMARWEDLKTPTEEEGTELMSPLADSILLEHGEKTDRVYVLIHGWTNSPHQWEPFAQELYDRGHNVMVVRMPYHGLESHNVGELKHIKPEMLSTYMDDVTDVAVGFGDDVRVVGLSVGGTVAAWAGQNRSDVDLVMTISPMFGMGVLPGWANTFMMNLFSRLPNFNLPDPNEPEREHVYRGQSSKGVAEALIFGKSVLKQAESTPPAVKELIVVTNANDTTISNEDVYYLADQWEQHGGHVTRYEFPKELGLPHNSIDKTSNPDTDIVYDKLLELLGETPLSSQ